MIVGIAGLGLIGGSFAKAYSEAGWTVLGYDTDRQILDFAALSGAVNGELGAENIGSCDLVLVCTYPGAAVEWTRSMASHIGSKPVVIDCCGTKRMVCEKLFALAKEYGFTYLGGHPMAGTQYSGFKYSKANLFKGQPMVIVPGDFNDIGLLGRVRDLLEPAGFGKLSVSTAAEHDEMIAFTSQLAHVVSNVYIKSRTAEKHKGFSAGSYKDMTRVAWLHPRMWAELFIENKDCLLAEIDCFSENLAQTRQAIADGDMERLTALLDEGRRRKAEIDGR